MKEVEIRTEITSSVDVIIEYKRGNIDRSDAIRRFSALSGLDYDLAKSFIDPLTKHNVIPFSKTRK